MLSVSATTWRYWPTSFWASSSSELMRCWDCAAAWSILLCSPTTFCTFSGCGGAACATRMVAGASSANSSARGDNVLYVITPHLGALDPRAKLDVVRGLACRLLHGRPARGSATLPYN